MQSTLSLEKKGIFKNITAEASLDWARDPELVEGQRAQRINFFVCRETTTNKNITQFRALSFCPIVVSRLGKRGFPQRTLRLCGEMSESLSAIIDENLRLKIFCLGTKNIVGIVLLNILSGRN